MSKEARKLAEAHGGTWGEHPHFPAADWAYEVSNGDTRSSYWDWALSKEDE